MPRCVTGMPASAGAAIAELTPGHHLERNAGGRQRERLLAAAAEDERIAALEPHHPPPALRGANQQPDDELLADRRAAGALADENPLRRGCQLQRRRIDERVVQHQVRRGAAARPLVASAGRDRRGRRRPARRNRAAGTGRCPRLIADGSRARPRLARRRAAARRVVQGDQRLEQQRTTLRHRHCRASQSRRASRAHAIQASRSSGSSASSASRISPASAGASPSVDIAIVTPARRTDRAQVGAGVLHVVDRVDEQAARMRGGSHRPDSPPAAPPPPPSTPPRGRPRSNGRGASIGTGAAAISATISGATTVTQASGIEQRAQLAGRDRSAADHQHTAAGELEENRKN